MNLNLIFEFTKRDFTEKYAGSVLGVLWTFIWPFVNILIYTLIFSKLMGSRLPGSSSAYSYSIYIIAGILPWTTFSNSVLRASSIFVNKKNIISKIRIDLPLLPFYIILSETIIFLITFMIYIIFLISTGHKLREYIIIIPFIYMVQQAFAYAMGLIIAIFYVFIRDLAEIAGVLFQIWFWFTPIVYLADILPDIAKKFINLNPAFWFVKAYQDILVFGKAPNFTDLMLLTALGHILFLIAYFCYKKLEKDIRDFL